MTVLDNLLLGLHGAGGSGTREMLERVLDRFPILRARVNQRAGTLSGGEQQQLVIARALVGRPRLVMIDEPSLGLAPLLVREIFALLAELRRDGLTVLLVEQNARQALQIADRAYLLEAGRVVRAGPAAELLASQAVIRAYLGASERASRKEARRGLQRAMVGRRRGLPGPGRFEEPADAPICDGASPNRDRLADGTGIADGHREMRSHRPRDHRHRKDDP